MTAAVPTLSPDGPRTETLAYFADGRAFGSPLAAPAIDESPGVARHLGWSDAQIHQAAEIGERDGDDLSVEAIEQVCRRLNQLLQADAELDALRRQLSVLHGVGSALLHRIALLVKERDQARIENIHLRHQIAGTTPVDVQLALDQAAREGEQTVVDHG